MVNAAKQASSDGIHLAATSPSRRRDELARLFGLAMPILGGQMSTAVASLIDAAMIGQLGARPVAAVGFGGLVFWVTVSLTVGVESAVQTLTARRRGEGRPAATGAILSEALRLALVVGGPLGLLLALLAPTLLSGLHGDPTVRQLGAQYLGARAISLAFVMGIAAFRGFYNGTSRPAFNLRVALAMLAVQVALNATLIYGNLGFPRLGVLGAGIAGAAASAVGFALFVGLSRSDREHGVFQTAPSREERKALRLSLARLGLPSGVQWALSWIAMLVFLYFAGRVGVVVAGATYVLIQLASFVSLAANSFGFAAASLVSQALGRGQRDEAHRWGITAACAAAGLLGTVGVGMALFRHPLLAALSSDPELVRTAQPALLACGLLAGADAFGIVIMFATIGTGAVRRVMALSLGGMWLLCLPVAWAWGVLGGGGMLGLWGALLGSRFVVSAALTLDFHRRRWASVHL